MLTSDRCPACHRRRTRSSDANHRYWLLLHTIAERLAPGGNKYSAEQWHLYCKSRWLGCEETRLPNGKTLLIPKTSADLSSDKFSDYVTAVEAWAAERDVYLDEMAA
jgi:NinB protein